MSDPISFDPFLGWVDTTDPDNIPPEVRIISAADLLRYENFAVAAKNKINAESVRVDDEIDRIDAANTAIDGLDTRLDAVEGGLTSTDRFIKKPSDTTRVSTTSFLDDPHLTLELGTNELIEFTAVLFVTSGTDGDIKFAFTGTGVTLGRWGSHNGAHVPGGSNPNGIGIGFSALGTAQTIVLHGILGAGSGGGHVGLQWAQLVSSATDTTLHTHSYLKTRTLSGG